MMVSPAPAQTDQMVLSAPLTHSDWMIHNWDKPAAAKVAWGPDGVRQMLETCKACGWSHVYWRTFDGGRSLYKSRLATPGEHFTYDWIYNPVSEDDKALAKRYGIGTTVTAQQMKQISDAITALDYSSFDSLASAVDIGHRLDLKIHAWVSINEDDHGWGLRSDFSLKHPECRWVKRNGRPYRSQMSFAYPEVREYKLGILREHVENYAIDGLFIDWIRTGDIRDNPQNDSFGVADYGYEQLLTSGFRQTYGVDPQSIPNSDERWIRYRAEPQTKFMRSLRQYINKRKPGLPVSVMVHHPWSYRGTQDWINGNLAGMLLDVRTWAREGLMDAAVAAGYYMKGGTPEMAFQALRDETERKVDLWLYAWVPSKVSDFERDFALAKKVGAARLLFWEADIIDIRPGQRELAQAMRRAALLP